MTRDPLTLIGDVLMTTICTLFAIGGAYGVLFFLGWCLLSLYDVLVSCLGA